MVKPSWKKIWYFFQNSKHRVIMRPKTSTLQDISRRNKSKCPHRNLYSQKIQITQMSISWWINKIWCIHTVQYYYAIKANEELTPTNLITWMNRKIHGNVQLTKNYEEIGNLNRSITVREWICSKNFQQSQLKSPEPDAFTGEFYQSFKE